MDVEKTVEDSRSPARPDVLGPLLAERTGDRRWLEVEPRLITGGKSNLTYLLVSPAGELVLRRPPTGSILATAHDMSRELRVQTALSGSAVPVPEILLHDDGELIGAAFYVMTKVPGIVVRDELPTGYATSPAERAALGHALVDTLADLHAVPPADVGLSTFGRPAGFAERQVRRWSAQIRSSRAAPAPALEELAARLLRTVPPDPRPAIVHGDYRLDNCMVDCRDGARPGTITGVLDWEMSTLGDPLTDLGLLLFYWRAVRDLAPALVPCVTWMPGFPTTGEVARRWSQRTGIPIDNLDWYVAFAHFKFAGITQGIQARVAADAMGGQNFGDLESTVVRTAEAGLELTRP